MRTNIDIIGQRSSLTYRDKSIWRNGTLSFDGIQKAISRKDPNIAYYIIKLVKLDPMPKNWFYVNQENDDLDNPNRVSRKKEELYSSDSEAAKRKINEILQTLCNKDEMKRRMKVLYYQQTGENAEQNMQPHHTKLNRSLIKEIYAKISADLWSSLLDLDDALLPSRLRLDTVLTSLYKENSLFARTQLFILAQGIPFRYGVWHGIKSIFRKSIEDGDWEMFGIWAARFEKESTSRKISSISSYDCNPENYNQSHNSLFTEPHNSNPDISKNSIQWLNRRSWMVLREHGLVEPEQYVSVAVEILRSIDTDSSIRLSHGWLFPHIFAHKNIEVQWNRKSINLIPAEGYNRSNSMENTEGRAFLELWKNDLNSVLRLFETAQSQEIRNYAIRLLKIDFSDKLSSLPMGFISRVISCKTFEGTELAYLWLSSQCGFGTEEFVAKGAHIPTLALLRVADELNHDKALTFSKNYIANHAKELVDNIPISDLHWMINHNKEQILSLGVHLFGIDQYQTQMSLEDWTSFYETFSNSRTESIKQLTKTTKEILTIRIRAMSDFSWFFKVFEDSLSNTIKLATEFLQNKSTHPKGDFLIFAEQFLCTPLLHKHHESFYNTLKEVQNDNHILYGFSQESQRMIFLGPLGETYCTGAQENSNVELSLLGINFLKRMIDPKTWRKEDWIDTLGTYGDSLREAYAEHDIDPPNGVLSRWRGQRIYGLDSSALTKIRTYMEKKLSIHEIGPDWVITHCKELSADFDFVRNLALKKLPISAWGEDGSQILLNAYSSSSMGSKYSDFLLAMLKERFNTHREYTNVDHVEDELALKNPHWNTPKGEKTGTTIQSLIRSKKPVLRELGLFFSKYLIREYAKSVPLDFRTLEPLFLSPYLEVRSFFTTCIEEGADEYGYLDFYAKDDSGTDIFKTEDLIPYLSHANFRIRDIGMSIMTRHPQKFAKLDFLFLLTSSTDRRIRELIVTQLWSQYQKRGITLHWKPFPQSRVPQSPTIRNPIRVRRTLRKDINHVFEQHSREWVIGDGIENVPTQESMAFERLEDFIRYVLFRLPPKMPLISQSKRLSKAATAWKNKVSLIEAISHVAQQEDNKKFASLILPILDELLESESKTEREALLVARTKIKRKHVGL